MEAIEPQQQEQEREWTVYLLANAAGQTYVGITTDLARRVRQHNGEVVGGARATRGRGTWQPIYIEDGIKGRSAAQSREYYLKRDRSLRRRLVKGIANPATVGVVG